MVQQAEQSQPAIHTELRHERNIRATHVKSIWVSSVVI